jgi:hypothetical protein
MYQVEEIYQVQVQSYGELGVVAGGGGVRSRLQKSCVGTNARKTGRTSLSFSARRSQRAFCADSTKKAVDKCSQQALRQTSNCAMQRLREVFDSRSEVG